MSNKNEVSFGELNRESKALMGKFEQESSDFMQRFNSMRRSSIQDGALDVKTKELIALAVAIQGQCDRCIGLHLAGAKRAGASDEEVRETIEVCTVMGGGLSLMAGMDTLKALDEL